MLPIVPQSTPASYSPLLALPAPKIAGLLPAHTASSAQRQITSLPEPFYAPRPSRVFRSFAEWDAADAEIESFLVGARQRLSAVYAEVMRDLADLSAYTRPTCRPPMWRLEVAL